MNQSKVRDPRFWKRWTLAGACRPIGQRFQITTKRTWKLHDMNDPDHLFTFPLEPGTYVAERRTYPARPGVNWLVIYDYPPFAGHAIGMAEGAWRQWKNGEPSEIGPSAGKPIDWEEFEVIVKALAA